VILNRRACIRVVSRWVRFVSCGLVVAAFGSLLTTRTARATIIITAPTISVPYSATEQTVAAEVYVQDTDATSPEVGDQQVKLDLPAASGLTFASAGATVEHPYLFEPQSPATSVAGDVVYGTDFPYEIAPPVLANGDGLLLVDISIPGGTTGDIPLMLDTDYASDPAATALFDQSNNPIAFSVQNGAIDISSPATSVPEPSSVVLAVAALAGAGLLGYRRKTRR